MKNIMNAGVLEEINKIIFKEVDYPSYGQEDIVVKVKCSGICGSDISRIKRKGTYSFPTIPGHEFSGIIVEVGKNAVDSHIGDRVAVFPLVPCMKCNFCRKEKYNLCDEYDYLGSRSNGGFAEFVKCPSKNAIELPPNVTFREGALIEPLAVALHGLRRIKPKKDEVILILGLGPIGIFSGQWAKLFGCKVIGVGRNDKQLEIARKVGFDYCYVNQPDIENKLREIGLIDAVIECSGSVDAQKQAIALVRKGGQILFVGNAEEDLEIDNKLLSKIVRGELSITGAWNSDYFHEDNDWKRAIDALKNKKIMIEPLITHSFKLKDISKVFDDLYTKKFFFCKTVFEF